jgi:hypothetical protein
MMFPDHMSSDFPLGGTVIMVHQDAAGQRAANGNGRDSGFIDPPDQLIPRAGENDLISENHSPVKIPQIRERKNPVLASVPVVSEILAKTVENPQIDIPVPVCILFQAAKGQVDQLKVPVDSKIRDPVRPVFHKEGPFTIDPTDVHTV